MLNDVKSLFTDVNVIDNVRDSVRPMKKEKSLDKKRKREEMLAHVNQTQLAKQLQGRNSIAVQIQLIIN